MKNKKLKNINKKITSSKTKHSKAEKEITNLLKEFNKYQEKGMIFCQLYCILQAMMNISFFRPMLNLLTMDNNKKVIKLVIDQIIILKLVFFSIKFKTNC